MGHVSCILFFILLTYSQVTSSQTTQQDCTAWLDQVISDIEQIAPEQRLAMILRAISRGCSAIPALLQAGARNALGTTHEHRKTMLAESALALLPKHCRVRSAHAPAQALAKRCPLPQALGLSDTLLQDFDAGTYAFAWALQQSLISTQQYNARGQRLLLNLFLSGALLNEAADQQK